MFLIFNACPWNFQHAHKVKRITMFSQFRSCWWWYPVMQITCMHIYKLHSIPFTPDWFHYSQPQQWTCHYNMLLEIGSINLQVLKFSPKKLTRKWSHLLVLKGQQPTLQFTVALLGSKARCFKRHQTFPDWALALQFTILHLLKVMYKT